MRLMAVPHGELASDGRLSDSGLRQADYLAGRLPTNFDVIYSALDPASVATAGRILQRQTAGSFYRVTSLQADGYDQPLAPHGIAMLARKLQAADIKDVDPAGSGELLRSYYTRIGSWVCSLAGRSRQHEQKILAVAPPYAVGMLRSMIFGELQPDTTAINKTGYNLHFDEERLLAIAENLSAVSAMTGTAQPLDLPATSNNTPYCVDSFAA